MLLVGVLLLSGCGVLDGSKTAAPPAAAVATTPDVAQASNGPLVGLPAEPLGVKLGTPNRFNPHFTTYPRGGLLFDFDTGRVIWAHNPTRVLPMASITKMMTALLAVEKLPVHTTVKVTKEALAYQGSGVGVLPKGKRISLETMLYGLLLPSGNDAAIAISQRVSGTLPKFVDLMNAKAQSMHLSCTHFSRPDGFEDAHNHSCAYDLAALAAAVIGNPRLAPIVGTFSAVRHFPIKGGKLYLYNNNPLLRTAYPGTIGVKTGYTDAAGHSFVGAVRRHGHTLGVVLLHSPNIGDQSKKLFDAAFALPEYRQ